MGRSDMKDWPTRPDHDAERRADLRQRWADFPDQRVTPHRPDEPTRADVLQLCAFSALVYLVGIGLGLLIARFALGWT